MTLLAVLAAASLCIATGAAAQTHDPDAAERQAAMGRLAFMHGEWVGPAHGANMDGTPYTVTQTERIGPLLGGDILLVEGHGYNPDGTTGFNAMAVISYDTRGDRYLFRSYAGGSQGDFDFRLTDNGYVWEVPAGPGVMRYTADVTATTYHEVGDFVMPGQPPRRSFEMTLARRGDSAWPAGGAVNPRP